MLVDFDLALSGHVADDGAAVGDLVTLVHQVGYLRRLRRHLASLHHLDVKVIGQSESHRPRSKGVTYGNGHSEYLSERHSKGQS